MRVISRKRLREFAERHPDAEAALMAWCKVIERHNPRNFAQMRALLGSVDKVGDLHVFDIRGNRYRLVCSVSYSTQACYIKQVLTHAEYDRGISDDRRYH
jgi:mRNA interferase HigB